MKPVLQDVGESSRRTSTPASSRFPQATAPPTHHFPSPAKVALAPRWLWPQLAGVTLRLPLSCCPFPWGGLGTRHQSPRGQGLVIPSPVSQDGRGSWPLPSAPWWSESALHTLLPSFCTPLTPSGRRPPRAPGWGSAAQLPREDRQWVQGCQSTVSLS